MKLRKLPYLLLAALSTAAHGAGGIELNGFGTLGVTGADSDIYGFRSDITSDEGVYAGELEVRTDSLLGLQLEATLSNELTLVTQAVLKDRVDPSLDRAIQLAFARYEPMPGWSFRLGRTGLDIFQLTESRHIGFSYLWARPPVEFYGAVNIQKLDGIDAAYTHRLDSGLLRAKLFAGTSEGPVATNFTNSVSETDDIFGGELLYEVSDWQLRLNHLRLSIGKRSGTNNALFDGINALEGGVQQARQNLAASLPNLPSAQAIAGDFDKLRRVSKIRGHAIRYSALGVNYQPGRWVVQSEVGTIDSASPIIAGLRNAYLSVGYRIQRHTVYTLASTTDSDQQTTETNALESALTSFGQVGQSQNNTQLIQLSQGGNELLAGVDQSRNFYHAEQSRLGLGWRWNLRPNIALKLQWDRFRIQANGDTFWLRRTEQAPEETVNVFTFNTSFVF